MDCIRTENCMSIRQPTIGQHSVRQSIQPIVTESLRRTRMVSWSASRPFRLTRIIFHRTRSSAWHPLIFRKQYYADSHLCYAMWTESSSDKVMVQSITECCSTHVDCCERLAFVKCKSLYGCSTCSLSIR